jgi:hypothetical protein
MAHYLLTFSFAPQHPHSPALTISSWDPSSGLSSSQTRSSIPPQSLCTSTTFYFDEMSRDFCSGCQSIDFRKYLYESKLFAASLGSWEQICKRKQCPLCRLVRDAFTVHACKPSPKSFIMLSNRKSWKCCTSYNEYHGIRYKDYSNEFDLHAHAERTRTKSRYQFVVYWKRGPEDCVEVLLRPLREGPFFGRVVDQEHADLSLCREWLDLCDDYHAGSLGQCIGKKTSRRLLQEFLRLIDVDKMRIIRGSTDGSRYVALSYVWGQEKMERETPRSLKAAVRIDNDGVETIELPELLPRTIQDSIEVTRSIGYHYLWVDSLCIIQDDPTDQERQLDMMDEIYSNATLTIAAGSGQRKFNELLTSHTPNLWLLRQINSSLLENDVVIPLLSPLLLDK